MADPFLSEIRIFGFNFAPRGWAQCDGQLLPINQYQSLYSLLGTTYGGDGRTTFALPDLRGRVPVSPGNSGAGTNITYGAKTGQETVALTSAQLPQHTHVAQASSTDGNNPLPAGKVLAATPAQIWRDPDTSMTSLKTGTVANAGGGQPHDNMQPFLALNYCIALQGNFPSRN